MKRYTLILSVALLGLISCTKEEGEGGRSSIRGTVHMTDKNGANQGEYDVPDYDVYIIYGDKDDIYDDDMKTNYDGTFQFKNLRKGNYRVYVYTTDANEPSGLAPVFKSISLGNNEDADIGTFEVER
ncbi:MAG: hypothetical protein KDD41_05405 [Flavobacteriales bacterium]|nr:hypothetical protein [Flavobacteriales bacterium]